MKAWGYTLQTLSSGKIAKSVLPNFTYKQALSNTRASVLEDKQKINHSIY